MKDITFKYDYNQKCFDIDFVDGKMTLNESFENAVAISLFTDAKCDSNEIPFGEVSRKGFWADAVDGYITGSKLWTIARAKRSTETLEKVKDFARKSLEWMLDDEFVTSIEVQTNFDSNNLILEIKLEINSDYKEYIFNLGI